MAIELRFSNVNASLSKNEGTSIPPWYQNETDFTKWFYGTTPTEYNYWYNIVNNEKMYVQYGTNMTSWGSGRFFVQGIEILNETENADGSITVEIRSRLERFIQRRTEMTGSPYDVDYSLELLDNEVYTYSGNAGDNIAMTTPTNWITKTFTVSPQEYRDGAGINLHIHYPNGEANDTTLIVGFSLFNNNPLTYVPMSIRKNGTWQKLNDNNGKIKRRINNTWVDKSTENMNTQREINTGKNRIRRSGNFRQVPLL